MVKYIGSKRVLVPALVGLFQSLDDVRSVVDLFSGTSRVGHALKGAGFRVLSNDLMSYACALATCYVQADRSDLANDAQRLVDDLNELPGEAGYVTETFCRQSRYFQEHNGARIDAIRRRIADLRLDPELEAVLLTSLLEAADRVDSTVGVQMAFLKQWAPRSYNALEMRIPDLLDRARFGKGEAHQLDALVAAQKLSADAAYIDPPYNQHSYLGNYHIWETIVRWDTPEHYGVACKREDCRTRKSAFNRKREALDAMRQVVERLDVRHMIVSFNDEGFISKSEMIELLSSRGDVGVVERAHPRYVGARIGIHNPQGEKVGEVGRLRNREFIFVVGPDAHRLARSRDAVVAA